MPTIGFVAKTFRPGSTPVVPVAAAGGRWLVSLRHHENPVR
jgi:hypothetical protein